jgi:hypothetical protein
MRFNRPPDPACNGTLPGTYGDGCVDRWYYWRLKPEEAFSYYLPWIGYLSHQITVWAAGNC